MPARLPSGRSQPPSVLTSWFKFAPVDDEGGRSSDQQPANSTAAHATINANLILFFITRFWRRLLRHLAGINLATRHPVLFVSPPAKVNQLAALRTKRTPWIVLIFDRSIARRTLGHTTKLGRNLAKVKYKGWVSGAGGQVSGVGCRSPDTATR